jgi:S-formylglutathione hydrolase FrmB
MVRGITAALLALALLPASAGAVATPSFSDGTELHVKSVHALGSRLFELTLETPRLQAPTNVRILLPEDYDAHPRRRYPVLYLFHGTSGGAQDWTSQPGRAQDATDGLPLITVMPDAGVDSNGGSWFTNWVNGGNYGPPEWETWHIERLIPWIDRSLRTIASRRGRAIAGLSQGGFGAMSYAARHPDMFAAAASFSGAVDIAANPERADPLVTPIINATEVGLNRTPPNTIFGDRVTNEINWAAHDPATLAGNLRGMRLYAWTGNGNPGPLDDPQPNLPAMGIEAGVHELTTLFKGELDKRSIPIDYHDYGAGTHTWPYWERDLRELLGPLMRDFARPAPTPAKVDFQTDAGHWSEWGWDATITRAGREFSYLTAAGRAGFTLTGSGTATVVTPRFYKPRSVARVTVSGSSTDRRMRFGGMGRLKLELALPAAVRISGVRAGGRPSRRARSGSSARARPAR